MTVVHRFSPKLFRQRRFALVAMVFTSFVGLLASLSAQTGTTGAIRGVVLNDATGNFVQGARLSLVDTPRTAVTDSQGKFLFGAVAAGDYRLRVESAGTDAKEFPVTVLAGMTAPLTLRLASEIIAMEKLMVTAQAEGQSQALNFQKNSENIRKVASLDALANSRLGEVGEVLQSMPGLYLEISTHQPVRPNIRGLSSEFNSITFDGVRIGNTNNDRSDGVSGYPAESLSRIELMKSVTPDMEGDAIGGSINLVSKRAFDLSERLFKFNLGGAYNNQQQNWDKQLNIEYADRYGPEGRLGVYQSINHYRSDRGYHTSSISYTVDAADQPRLPAAIGLAVRLQHARTHHRRERERHNRRNGDGADQGEGELGEERAGQAALEADRDIDGDQHHGHGDDRPAQLARRLDGGGERL